MSTLYIGLFWMVNSLLPVPTMFFLHITFNIFGLKREKSKVKGSTILYKEIYKDLLRLNYRAYWPWSIICYVTVIKNLIFVRVNK